MDHENNGGIFCIIREYSLVMQCVPSHNLREHTFTLTRGEAAERLNGLLKGHKHVWYMWIPYKDMLVVVTNDVVEEGVRIGCYRSSGTAGLRR